MKKHSILEGWKKWELALLLALCITLASGLWAQNRQQSLSDKLIRLHVIAASDSKADQAVKLKVRDGVLALLGPVLEGVENSREAEQVIETMLPRIQETAQNISGEDRVSVSLSMERYPTRQYENFALPAGVYRSLRVTLGSGEGQNWWCVVFPPLCLEAVEIDAGEIPAALTKDDVRLITESGGSYVLRFRLLELWGNLAEKFS